MKFNYQKKYLPIFLLFVFIWFSNSSGGISLGGTSGLVTIPTATVLHDRQVTIGIGVVNKNSAYLERGKCDNFPFYIVIGYLPRLEFSAGINFILGRTSYDGTDTYKDGVVSLQYLLLNEKKILPALSVGVRDIYSFILLNTSYVVMSKTIIQRPTSIFRLHLGYGSDIIDRHIGVPKHDRKHPVGHTIVGVFGGLDIQWFNILVCMLEYDTEKINIGLRVKLNPYFNIDIDFLNMEELSGSMNLSFRL